MVEPKKLTNDQVRALASYYYRDALVRYVMGAYLGTLRIPRWRVWLYKRLMLLTGRMNPSIRLEPWEVHQITDAWTKRLAWKWGKR